MQLLFNIFFILGLVSLFFVCIKANGDGKTFSVVDYGARGDGKSDDSQAFKKAWTESCKATGKRTLLIPAGKSIIVDPMFFIGPCRSGDIYIKVEGKILAPASVKSWSGKNVAKWLAFKSIDGLHIHGSGELDGRGKAWWDISCRYHPGKGCNMLAPTMLSFDRCNQLEVRDVTVTDSPQTHILVIGSENVGLRHLTIQAPEHSPNTDGIHIHASRNVSIDRATIGVGDDCVSMGDRSSYINITNVNCGPGHGISIGSLGMDGSAVDVHSITVMNSHFKGTTNGARIKTWQVGRGTVKNIVFSGLNFTDVENPIIIDQYYCDKSKPETCNPSTTGVQVSDVHYNHLFGTSKTEVAVNLNCSNNVPCKNIVLDTIKLNSAVRGVKAISSCNHAFGSARGTQQPKSCVR